MKSYVLCLTATLALLVLALPAVSSAGPVTDTVNTTVDKVITILNDPAMKGPAKEDARRKKIMNAVTEVFDFGEMAKRSLGLYWKVRKPAERAEFVSLFTDLIERSYINRIEGYSGEKIIYDKEDVDGDNATVKSHFLTKRRETIPVDYKLILENGKWRVYDMVIENVSLVNNYRVQFNKIIRTSSYEDLVKKMKNKAETENFVSSK